MTRTGNILGNSMEGERAVRKFTQRIGILAAAAAFVGVGTSAQAQSDLLYDWRKVDSSTPVPAVTGYIPAPFVSTGNVSAAALSTLTANQTAFGGKVAVKIVGNTVLSPADNASLFSNPSFQVNYAFMDYEGVNSFTTAQTQAAAIQVLSSTTSRGNFRMFPGSGDTSGVGSGPSTATYATSGMNMANEDLYPGQATYKNPPGTPGGTSTSPNIRSSLFVLPIDRASFVTLNLTSNSATATNKHIPYVNRFNNSGNSALDSDNNPSNGYRFDNPTGQQMLSRGDFSAMVAHYRLRGVDGVHLLDGGVVGYTQSQFEQDAKDGFQMPTVPSFAALLGAADHKLATLDNSSKTTEDGVATNESTGVVYSGVYSLTQGKLDILASNMSANSKHLEFASKIGNKTVGIFPNLLLPGTHTLLEFTAAGTQWNFATATPVFTDSDRSGVGVPEPVAMGGASIFALTMLFRRRRSV
jgi:hypothetical protein